MYLVKVNDNLFQVKDSDGTLLGQVVWSETQRHWHAFDEAGAGVNWHRTRWGAAEFLRPKPTGFQTVLLKIRRDQLSIRETLKADPNNTVLREVYVSRETVLMNVLDHSRRYCWGEDFR